MWLYSKSIKCDQFDNDVEFGRFLHKINYVKNKKEVEFGGVKFDLVKKVNGTVVVSENKKSLRFMEASKYQLAYYLYLLKKAGIKSEGYLVCPSEKKKVLVELTDEIEEEIKKQHLNIEKIIESEFPPVVKKCKYCAKCAYNEYCFS